MLGAQGLKAGRDLYRATPAVTRDLGFSGLIRRTAPFSRLLRPTRGCEGSIPTLILTGPRSVASNDTQGDVEDLFFPGFRRGHFTLEKKGGRVIHSNIAICWSEF